MRTRKLMLVGILLFLVTSAQAQRKEHFVLLPARAAAGIADRGTWQPTKEDLNGAEANLWQISGLKAEGWHSDIRIDHPKKYFRQYVAIILGSQKRIYINAFCNEQALSYWRDRLVVVSDGGTCFWQAMYDPATKKFSNLRINGRG